MPDRKFTTRFDEVEQSLQPIVDVKDLLRLVCVAKLHRNPDNAVVGQVAVIPESREIRITAFQDSPSGRLVLYSIGNVPVMWYQTPAIQSGQTFTLSYEEK